MRPNPKASAKSAQRSKKPPKPAPKAVKEEEIDHSAGAEDAVPLVPEEIEETVAGGAFDPNNEDPKPAAPKPKPKTEPTKEETDPGKTNPPKFNRGAAPGEPVTF